MRWERVEMEARKILRGEWIEPKQRPEKNALRTSLAPPRHTPVIPIDERELYGASSLADRIRVVTDEEWAGL
jgi:hypothetical protein